VPESVPTTRSSSRFLVTGLLAAGLSLAAVAQWILEKRPSLRFGGRALQDALAPVWPHPSTVLLSLAIFAVAIVSFVAAVRRFVPPPALPPSPFDFPARHGGGRVSIALADFGLVLGGSVLLLTSRQYRPFYPALYLLAVLLMTGAFLWEERRLLREVRARLDAGAAAEIAAVTALISMFVALSTWDLRSWYFSAIGDEYAFRNMSMSIVLGDKPNLFSQYGTYGIIPVLDSYGTAILMKVFGTDVMGWKVSALVPVAASLPLYYLLARVLYGWRTAFLCLGMLASAHYLLAYVHTGYANLGPLLPTAAALLLLAAAFRRPSRLLLWASGLAAGLGWYTYYGSRVTIFILGAIVAWCVPRRRWFAASWPLVFGFLVALAPMVVTDGKTIVVRMVEQSGTSSNEVVRNRAMLPTWNTGRSLLAFNYNTHDGPYLYGSLAEPVTAAFFLLGLGLALGTLRDARSRFLLAWFGLGLTATGILSKYDYVSTSRLHLVLPAVALLAALAVETALCAGGRLARGEGQGRLGDLLAFFIVVAVTSGNLHRWFVEAPTKLQGTADAVLVRILQKHGCLATPRPTLVVDVGIGGEIGPALEATGRKIPVEFALYVEGPSPWIETVPERCVVFRSPFDADARPLLDALEKRWPTLHAVKETDVAHRTTLLAFYPSSAETRGP
jgi:type IV secretory pathway protease TraF